MLWMGCLAAAPYHLFIDAGETPRPGSHLLHQHPPLLTHIQIWQDLLGADWSLFALRPDVAPWRQNRMRPAGLSGFCQVFLCFCCAQMESETWRFVSRFGLKCQNCGWHNTNGGAASMRNPDLRGDILDLTSCPVRRNMNVPLCWSSDHEPTALTPPTEGLPEDRNLSDSRCEAERLTEDWTMTAFSASMSVWESWFTAERRPSIGSVYSRNTGEV